MIGDDRTPFIYIYVTCMNQTGDDAAILFRISQLILVIILLNPSRDMGNMGWFNQPLMTLERWAVSTDGLPKP